jgi:hypothetical protein
MTYTNSVTDNMIKVAIDHIEYVHTKIRFSMKKVALAHAFSEHGPFGDATVVHIQYSDMQHPKVQESLSALRGRLNRQMRQLVSLAYVYNEELFDKRPELGIKFYQATHMKCPRP